MVKLSGMKKGHTKYSRVLGISNIDLIPADTTATGVLPSSVRSHDISNAETISCQNL